ncbi:MAG: dihydroneopterin aldolase, partial [Alphaproteobacteria bacterium]|nr:dihydroneopterin aldolase [Alphaproteobacteria bacterium]
NEDPAPTLANIALSGDSGDNDTFVTGDTVTVVWDASAATGDDIANVVSYEDVISGIKDLLARGHVGLVETLAEEIADICLDDGRVRVVRVRVEKLDVFDEAVSVGVEIERQSHDST